MQIHKTYFPTFFFLKFQKTFQSDRSAILNFPNHENGRPFLDIRNVSFPISNRFTKNEFSIKGDVGGNAQYCLRIAISQQFIE